MEVNEDFGLDKWSNAKNGENNTFGIYFGQGRGADGWSARLGKTFWVVGTKDRV